MDDVIFHLREPKREYAPRHVAEILLRAEQQGHPLIEGSYLEKMTISQIERLLDGRYDA